MRRKEMPVKFGKTVKQVERGTKKTTIVHEYMKSQSIKTLIDKFNNEGTQPKLKRKIRVEFDRRNKLGLDKVIFIEKEEPNGILG
jgi:Cu/Ag efflux protein CusF